MGRGRGNTVCFERFVCAWQFSFYWGKWVLLSCKACTLNLIMRGFHTTGLWLLRGSWDVAWLGKHCPAFRKSDLGSTCSPLVHWLWRHMPVISECLTANCCSSPSHICSLCFPGQDRAFWRGIGAFLLGCSCWEDNLYIQTPGWLTDSLSWPQANWLTHFQPVFSKMEILINLPQGDVARSEQYKT